MGKFYKVIISAFIFISFLYPLTDFNASDFKIDFEFEDINLKIIPYFNPAANTFDQVETDNFNEKTLDCFNSRIVSSKGVFCCPVLCNDFRARTGATLESFSKKAYLDTEKCFTCVKHGTKAFSNDWM